MDRFGIQSDIEKPSTNEQFLGVPDRHVEEGAKSTGGRSNVSLGGVLYALMANRYISYASRTDGQNPVYQPS